MFEKVLIGADPELFVKNNNNDGFISAHNLIPGTKKEPFRVHAGAIQVDGTAAEFNIDPADSADVFVGNVLAVRQQLGDRLPPGLRLVAVPVADFDPVYFDAYIPPEAKELGCDPDFNAWTGLANDRPDGDAVCFRTGSGHVHIGWTNGASIQDAEHIRACERVVQQMDYYLGVPSLLWDPDGKRRVLYGKAGAYRPKSYGVEYRTLSNRWVDSEALMRWIYDAIRLGLARLDDGFVATEKYGDAARKIIDNNDVNWPNNYSFDLGLTEPPKLAA